MILPNPTLIERFEKVGSPPNNEDVVNNRIKYINCFLISLSCISHSWNEQ